MMFTTYSIPKSAACWVSKYWIEKLKINEANVLWRFFQIVRTFITVSLLRVCSRAESFADAGLYYKKIFTLADIEQIGFRTFFPAIDKYDLVVVLVGCLALYIISMLQFRYPKVRQQLFTKNYFVQSFVIMALIFSIIIFGTYGSGMDVGGFIYAQF